MKKWKLTTKRGFALFIALLMCMGAMQLTAFAAEEDGLPVPEVETVTNADEPETDPVVLPEETQPVEGADETQEPADAAEPVETEQPEEPVATVEPEEPVEVEEPSDAEPAEEEVAVPEEPEAEPAEEPAEDAEPVEPAAGGAAPVFTGFSIGGHPSVNISTGCFYTKAPAETLMADSRLVLNISEGVRFVQSQGNTDGKLYVSGVGGNYVNLNFGMTVSVDGVEVNLRDSLATITLTANSNYDAWSGTPSPVAQVSLSALATSISGYTDGIVFDAGGVETIATPSAFNEEYRILANQDVSDVFLAFVPNGTALHTITYVGKTETLTWRVPDGMPLGLPVPMLAAGETFGGWYMDEGCTVALASNATASADTILYAKITPAAGEDNVSTAITNKTSEIHIKTLADWNIFTSRVSEIDLPQRVILDNDLSLENGTYAAISFKANFDGNGKTLSNATFRANGNNSGVFATIENGQVVANLTLQNIVVNNATNAGVVVGSVNHATIQNVQVRNCQVNGRNAGGIAGYGFLSTIKYCSTRDTKITGLVSGGGIVALAYTTVSDCYSTGCTISGWKYRASIVANSPEASHISYCWGTYSNLEVVKYHGGDTVYDEDTCVQNLTNVMLLINKGYDTDYWDIGSSVSGIGFTDAAAYSFSNDSPQ